MLPTLSESPKFEATIPSSGKPIFFRPFLVKEEKVLLMAFEGRDRKAGIKAISDVILSCVETEIDPEELTLYDVEYLFTKIRSKSVGEVITFSMPCSECKEANEIEIDLEAVTFTNDKLEMKKRIVLTDEISVEVRLPTYMSYLRNDKIVNAKSEVDRVFEIVYDSLYAIYTEEDHFLCADEPREEIVRFIESMTSDQFKEIKEFLESAPSLTLDFDFDCKSCGTHNDVHVERLEDFFPYGPVTKR